MFDKNEGLGSMALLLRQRYVLFLVYDWSRLYIQLFLGVKDSIFSLLYFRAYEYLAYTSDSRFLPPITSQS